MKYQVFLSHSMNEKDQAIIKDVKQAANNHGISVYLAEENPAPGTLLSEKIEKAISDSEVFIALWTKSGANSQYVNQEIGYAKRAGKPLLLMVEKGVGLNGFEVGREFIEIDPNDPSSALKSLDAYFLKKSYDKDKRELINGFAFLVIGALVLVALTKD